MTSRGGRLSSGDVLEIAAGGHFVYLQYVGRRELFGDTVLVSPVLHERRREPHVDLFSDGYFAFYPAATAVHRALAAVVGSLPAPPVPMQVRRPATRSPRGIESWAIDDDTGGTTVKASLSAVELRLPEGAIVNHQYLIRQVAEGWSPSRHGQPPKMSPAAIEELLGRVPDQVDQRGEFQRGKQAPAGAASAKRSAAPATPTILHYLYAPTRRDADAAARRLRDHSYRTEVRPSADGDNWLVLARNEAEPADAETARALLEALATDVGGEYDGWEIDTAVREAPRKKH